MTVDPGKPLPGFFSSFVDERVEVLSRARLPTALYWSIRNRLANTMGQVDDLWDLVYRAVGRYT